MEYKFRGKSKRTDEWVYGSYHFCNQKGIMRTRKWGTVMDIIEEEVQFNSHWILAHQTPGSTGWDIRETFIPHEVYPETVGQCSTVCDQSMKDIYEDDMIKVAGRLLKVVFDAGCFLSIWGQNRYRLNQWGSEGVQLIGNIHDNPELLNPASGKAGVNHMTDPNLKAEGQEAVGAVEEAKAETANEQATEGTQESAEEGNTEG